MAVRRNMIRDVIAAFDGVHVEPAIPANKLAKARAHCRVPNHEDVIGLIDCTLFGSAKLAVVFGSRRIYIHDDWTATCPDGIAIVDYTEIERLEDVPGFDRSRRERLTRPTRAVLEALRLAIERANAVVVREPDLVPEVRVVATGAFVPSPATVAPDLPRDHDDVSVSPEATALQAAITATPEDDAPQLVLADLLLAADDPRGELIVLHHRELASGLSDPDALERYLWLAAEYGFPHPFPEAPTLPFVGTSNPVRYDLAHQLREYQVRSNGHTLALYVGGREVLSRRLRTHRNSSWTESETAVILRTISDAIRAGTPLKSVQFPFVDDPLPTYGGGALRVYMLPRDYTGPRGIAPNRYGLAARDYDRWLDVWRRLARTLKAARSA